MKKRLKIFLTISILTFSFTFITNIKAVNYYDIDVDYVLNKFWNYANGKDVKQLYPSSQYSGTLLRNSYPYVSITKSLNNPYYTIYFYKNINDYTSIYSGNAFDINSERNKYSDILYVDYNYSNDAFSYVNFSHVQNSSTKKYWARIYTTDSSYYGFTKSITNFTISNRVTKSFDYSATPFVFNFHLNGGWVRDPRDNWGSEEDFSFTLYSNEVEEFITNLEVNKLDMIFEGWYYDSGFTQPFTLNDSFNSDVDLYAKFRYKSVDDFLNNVEFNEHTFDDNYDYAIINRGDNSNDVFIGLPFSRYDIEVYEYQENLNSYKDGSSVCLVPVYDKNNIFYYNLNTLFTNNQEVMILPRSVFNELENIDYTFYLTTNAYISYTNDLSHAEIVNSNGEHITTNLQNAYELSQSYLNETRSQENQFKKMKAFINDLKRMNSVWNECFDCFYNGLPSLVRSLLIFIFNALMILICFKLVGWE